MNDQNLVLDAEQPAEFFAPVSTDLFTSLIGQYEAARAKIQEVAALAEGSAFQNAVSYFIEGNAGDERTHRAIYVEKLFKPEGAIAALNSAYWSKALAMTDVLEMMPQARRDQWHKEIREHTTPDFTEEAVRPTLVGLLNMRQQFLAEKIDGIFRGLSGEHVTNAPEAFGKRMILRYVRTSYGTINHTKSGLIHDLRCVIARFMGRDEARYASTDTLLKECEEQTGQWVTTDGGAIKVRTYKNGNGHMEIHPDMAYRLNAMLAHLYPTAIPPAFRQKPKRPTKAFPILMRPLPFAVLDHLERCLYRRRYAQGNAVSLEINANGPAYDEACRVLTAIGGTQGERKWEFNFDYRPDEVLKEIVVSGCLPDKVAFQFYPTPEKLGRIAVDQADIGPTDSILEPQAGQGALAALMPAEQLECVELSAMHCAILKARGFKVTQADFLEWSKTMAARGRKYDRIVMNPPFADGRAKLHVEHAMKLLKDGGKLVAWLPASMKGSQFIEGVTCEWSRVYSNEFAGTGAAVTLLTVALPARPARTEQVNAELEFA